MAAGNSDTYINWRDLPKVNGKYITSIYHKYDSFREKYTDMRYRDSTDYYELVTYFNSDKNVRVKELPDIFKGLFGKQLINGSQITVSSCHFRTDNSGHASSDDTMSLDGLSKNGTTTGFSLYLGHTFYNPNYMIDLNSEIAHMLLDCIKSETIVEELPDWYNKDFPKTFLRNEGGLNYPDKELPSWRKTNVMPYVTYDNKKTMRVYHEEHKAHVFIERVEKVEEGDDNLIALSYMAHYDEDNRYCHMVTWSRKFEKDPHGIVRFKISGLKNKRKKDSLQCIGMFGDKEEFKDYACRYTFYRIVNIIYHD